MELGLSLSLFVSVVLILIIAIFIFIYFANKRGGGDDNDNDGGFFPILVPDTIVVRDCILDRLDPREISGIEHMLPARSRLGRLAKHLRECMDNQCTNYQTIGTTIDGAFAPFLVAPERAFFKISPAVPRDEAALFEPLSCVVGESEIQISRLT